MVIFFYKIYTFFCLDTAFLEAACQTIVFPKLSNNEPSYKVHKKCIDYTEK